MRSSSMKVCFLVRSSIVDEASITSDVLLHLDLHPDNVILSPTGPILINWQAAVAGPAAADVAHTWLLIRTSVVPGPFIQRAVGTLGQRLFPRRSLDRSMPSK